jgi:hypothetical protein
LQANDEKVLQHSSTAAQMLARFLVFIGLCTPPYHSMLPTSLGAFPVQFSRLWLQSIVCDARPQHDGSSSANAKRTVAIARLMHSSDT